MKGLARITVTELRDPDAVAARMTRIAGGTSWSPRATAGQ
jgi:hypothetical protein